MSEQVRARLCPLRPPSLNHEEGGVEVREDSWDDLGDASVLREPQADIIGAVDDNEEAQADDNLGTRIPVGAHEPATPSRTEVAQHDLTHMFYRSWCPHCVMGRRPAAQHQSQPDAKCAIPLCCAECAQVRDAHDDEYAQLVIGRLYPALLRNRVGLQGG